MSDETTHPSEEGDVVERAVAIGELECEEFDDKGVLVSGQRSMILPVRQLVRQLVVYLMERRLIITPSAIVVS